MQGTLRPRPEQKTDVIDLSVAHATADPLNVEVNARLIEIFALTAGATFQLAFSKKGPWRTVRGPIDICWDDEESRKITELWIANTAQPGATVEFAWSPNGARIKKRPRTADTIVMFRADLQTGVNKHIAVTLTLAETDYTVVIPDSARFVTFSSASGAFRYAIGEAAPALAAKAGNAAAADFGVGGRVPAANVERTHVLPAGLARVLHLRSAIAAAVIDISVS